MKSTIALAAIAGLATAASAQGDFFLSIAPATATYDTTAGDVTFTIDVIGSASVGTHILGGAYTVSSNSGFVTDMVWSNPGWSAFPTDGGYAGNGNYNQTIVGQFVAPNFPPFDVPAPGSENDADGFSMGSFQITVAQGSVGTVDLSLLAGVPFTIEMVDVDANEYYRDIDGDSLTLTGATINLVPAPSAMALLGLGGLMAGRRRR